MLAAAASLGSVHTALPTIRFALGSDQVLPPSCVHHGTGELETSADPVAASKNL
jgi:hypothetical protein